MKENQRLFIYKKVTHCSIWQWCIRFCLCFGFFVF